MSRIGLSPITVEDQVEVSINGKTVTVKGPKGQIEIELDKCLDIAQEGNTLTLSRCDELKTSKSLHGTYRQIISNAIKGVKNGFEKKIEVVGVGFRVKMEGPTLVLNLGWNHPVKFTPVNGIVLETPDENTIVVKGIDKQLVGEYAAKIREIKKPEPYKGKGLRYAGEFVRSKSSKSSAK